MNDDITVEIQPESEVSVEIEPNITVLAPLPKEDDLSELIDHILTFG